MTWVSTWLRNAAAQGLAHLDGTLAVDGLPGGIGGVAELIGADAEDGAVCVVKLDDLKGQLASDVCNAPGDARGGPQLGTGVVAKGVEEEVVGQVCEEGGKGLGEASEVSRVMARGERQHTRPATRPMARKKREVRAAARAVREG